MSKAWKTHKREYPRIERLYLGKWVVGIVYRSSLVEKDDPDKYKAVCTLPGIDDERGYPTADEAKAVVENAVDQWLQMAALQESEK